MSTEQHRTVITTSSTEDTISVGQRLGALLMPGAVVALCGPLGAGKTTFVKGVALGLGLRNAHDVKSPTFVLIKEYAGRHPIAHVDLYRLDDAAQAEQLDLRAYLGGTHVCLIEWAEKFPQLLPADHLQITFEHRAPMERRITVTPRGHCARLIAQQLSSSRQRIASQPA